MGVSLVRRRLCLLLSFIWASLIPSTVVAHAVETIKLPPIPLIELADPQPGPTMPLRWNLSGATFDDGAVASGYFIWDASASQGEQLRDFDIFVIGGNATAFPTIRYSALTSQPYGALESLSGVYHFGDVNVPLTILFLTSDASYEGRDRQLRLRFSSILTNSGGTAALFTESLSGPFESIECYNSNPWRTVISGDAIAAVPEPHTFALLLAGIAVVGCAARRRVIRRV